MVDCTEFLDGYSDFRDGCMPAGRSARFETHVKTCDSCARYDRVVGGGVQVFRSLPSLAPSPDFNTRLLGRLYAVDGAVGAHGSGASLTVTLMICAALGFGAWIPALRDDAGPVRLPAIVAHAPYHDLTPVLMQSAPPAFRTAGFPQAPAYYGQGLLLDQSSPSMTLAARPTAYFQQR